MSITSIKCRKDGIITLPRYAFFGKCTESNTRHFNAIAQRKWGRWFSHCRNFPKFDILLSSLIEIRPRRERSKFAAQPRNSLDSIVINVVLGVCGLQNIHFRWATTRHMREPRKWLMRAVPQKTYRSMHSKAACGAHYQLSALSSFAPRIVAWILAYYASSEEKYALSVTGSEFKFELLFSVDYKHFDKIYFLFPEPGLHVVMLTR